MDTCKNDQFSLYGIQIKQFGVCTSPETRASIMIDLHGKVLAEVGMQMADKFKNQCVVNRLFAKYTDTQPADAKDIHKSCLQCLTFEI